MSFPRVCVVAMNSMNEVVEILEAMAWQCSADYWDERTSAWWPCRGPYDSKCPVTTEVDPVGLSCGCACHVDNEDE